jgi:nickel-dependent lactate racemase
MTFEVPNHADFLQIREPEYTINRESFCNNFLFRLSAAERDFSKVGIVVSDKTRLCGYNTYLPWIVKVLEQGGARKENMVFYIAYRNPSPADR